MTLRDEDKISLRQYLLGALSSEELTRRIEERLLSHDQYYQELLSAEDELIDLYLEDELSGEERELFTRHFLSTEERRKKLSFAIALNRYASIKASETETREFAHASGYATPGLENNLGWFRAFWNTSGWALRSAMALSLVIIVAAATFLLLRDPVPRTFAVLTLNASVGTRAEGSQPGEVKLPLNADALKIFLTLPDDFDEKATSYRVELETSKGATSELEILGRDGRSIFVVIPSERLEPGQYALKLFAIQADGSELRVRGSYFFNVE